MKRWHIELAVAAIALSSAWWFWPTGDSEATSEMTGRYVCSGERLLGVKVRTSGPGTWSVGLDPAACAGGGAQESMPQKRGDV